MDRRFLVTSVAGALNAQLAGQAQPTKKRSRVGFPEAACQSGLGQMQDSFGAWRISAIARTS